MSRFPVNPPLWWNSNECQVPQSLPKNLSLKEPSAQLCHDAKQLGLQVQDRDSSSTQSTGQSYHEVTAMGDASSQDQCISSESVQDERYGKSQLKQVIFPRNPDHVFNPSQVDYCYQMTHFPYPYAGPHFGGFMTAYGPQAAIQPQMVGIPPARVPLPADLAECGPIYVNAKQYNGIMRRRQSRAKLEAQNKLIKARKPYLHESRHLHALNRVRGSGGRFLSSKKLQHPDSTPTAGSNCVSDSVHLHQRANISQFKVDQTERKNPVTAITSCSDITSFPSNSVIYRQPDGRFSGITSRMVGTTMQGGGMCGGTQHRAPVVR